MSAAAAAQPQASSSRPPSVAIVGAGFGGIAAAIELKRHGIERRDDPRARAGSWAARGTTTAIPGAACDVPSHLYSFSFAQRRDWSRLCSPQAEIHSYLQQVARALRRRAPRRLRPHGQLVRVGRARGALADRDGRGRALRGRRAGARDRPAAPAGATRDRGHRDVRRAQLPLGAVGSRLPAGGQARGGRRHRRERRAVRPGDRRAGRAADGLPAHRQLDAAAPQPPLPARGQGGDRTRPRRAGVPAQLHVPVLRGDHRGDPPPAHDRAPRRAALGGVHALAAQRPARCAARPGRTTPSAASACCSAPPTCPRCNARTSSW